MNEQSLSVADRTADVVTFAASTVIEPLVASWSAFSFLLPPATASLHFSNYQLRLLNSFIAHPESHAKAAASPGLSGGAFINLPAARVSDVVTLREESVRVYAENKAFADDLTHFVNEFTAAGDALALAPWYGRIPARLKPFVELVYDYHNRPHVRLIEPLLYRSSLYRRDAQALRLFTLHRDSDRAYSLNTPRLPSGASTELFVSAPFDSDACKAIVDAATTGLSFSEMRERMALSDREADIMSRLVAPVRTNGVSRETHTYTYLGHASMMIRWNGTTIVTDPVIGARPAAGGDDRYSFADLPDHIDYVAITHNHHDHFSIETLMRLAPRIGTLLVPRTMGFVYGDVSLKAIAHRCGIRNVVELDAFDSVPFADGEIIGVPFLGEHSDLPHSKCAYVVRTGDRLAFFGADSDNLNELIYAQVRNSVGKIHSVFIGTEDVGGPLSWTCGSLLPAPPARQSNLSRRSHGCDAKRALRLAELLEAQRVYCYGMGLEPWVRHLLGEAMSANSTQVRTANEFVTAARAAGYQGRLLNGCTSFD